MTRRSLPSRSTVCAGLSESFPVPQAHPRPKPQNGPKSKLLFPFNAASRRVACSFSNFTTCLSRFNAAHQNFATAISVSPSARARSVCLFA